jgi:putative ABC transport system ATP-binding protein
MKETLAVQHLYKTYGKGENAVHAVRDVSFVAGQGEFLAVVGPSGSGKTTLLAMLGGLLTPTSGRIVVGSLDVHALDKGSLARFRRRQIGFVFQGANVIPYLSARDNLLVVPAIAGRVTREHRERAAQLLEELGLSRRARALPADLSGGERQRVAIARALMNDPDLILVDEPTASLDSERGRQVVEMLAREITSRRKTGLMVTHDPRMAAYANRVLRLRDGTLTGDDSMPEDVLAATDVE